VERQRAWAKLLKKHRECSIRFSLKNGQVS